MIFSKEREELSSSCHASRVAARRPKHLDYTVGMLQVTLGNAAVFAVCYSSFRISHSLKTMYYLQEASTRRLSFSSAVPGLTEPVPPIPPAPQKVMRRRICALMRNTFPAKAPNFVGSGLTLRLPRLRAPAPAPSSSPAPRTKGSERSFVRGAQRGAAPGRCRHPPPAERPVPGPGPASAAPPAAEPPTDLSELAGEVEEGDGHAHGLQQHGGHQHGPAGLRGAGAARRQHAGAGWGGRAGLGAPGAPGAHGRCPAANAAPDGRGAQPAPPGMDAAGGAGGPSLGRALPPLFQPALSCFCPPSVPAHLSQFSRPGFSAFPGPAAFSASPQRGIVAKMRGRCSQLLLEHLRANAP